VSDVKRQLRELKEAKARLNDLVEMENPHIDQLESASARQKELQEKLEVAERETEVFQKKADLYEQAAEVFGPAGVRAHILDNVTPFLNSKTGHYLSLLSDGNITATWSTLSTTAKGELRERFVIEVAKATGGKSFGLLSGGEKRKVRLACALALQDLVATRASKPFRLFVADEIDDALDDAGLERLMSVLDEKAKERGTVLVISHNSLSDWIREVVTVEMTDGQSTVRGPICPSE
jgi:DNA repair exonuclease SbcCD ATPase subunit